VINILAQVIVEMIQDGLATRVSPRGKLIAAGIITDQESAVVTAMEQQGFMLAGRQQREDWVCLVAERG
jgi:ribosomal protein L11 methylase PrmA